MTKQPLIERIMRCVSGWSDRDQTDEEWTLTEDEQFALRSLLETDPAPSVVMFIMTVEAYIKARETTETQERLFRFQEMKDALKRVRSERKRAIERASTERIELPTSGQTAASKCQTCGKPLPIHGIYFMPCPFCRPVPGGAWVDATVTKPPVGPAPNGQPCNSGWSQWVLCTNDLVKLDGLGAPLFTAAYSWELNRWHKIGNEVCTVTHWRDDITAPAP